MSERTPVEWRVDATTSRPLRAVVYVEIGLFGGGMLLVLGGMAFLGVTAARGGEYTFLAYIVLLALVGGPLSLLYLWPVIVDSDQRPPLAAAFGDERTAERYAAVFPRNRLLSAVLGGSLVILALLSFEPRLVLRSPSDPSSCFRSPPA